MSLQSIFSRIFKGGYSILQGCGLFSTNEYIDKIYENPSFILAQQKKVKALKAVEWGVFKIDKEGNKEEIENHILDSIFQMPNNNTTWGEFLEYLTTWYDSQDNGVLIEKIVGILTVAPRLNLYNPDNFNITFSGTKLTKIQILNPSKVIVDEKELENYMWIKQPDFYHKMAGVDYNATSQGETRQRGMALLGAYIYNAWRWNNSLVKNSGKAPGLYSMERKLQKDEITMLKQKLDVENNLDNKGKDIILTGPNVKYTKIGTDPQDSDWTQGEKTAHERLANSLGVPAELVTGGDSTFANRQEARKELYHEEVIPWCRELTKRFNKFLEPWLNKGEKIDFVTSSIPALQADLGEIIKSLEGLKDRVTINEYRKIIADMTDYDLEAIDGGDDILVQSTMIALDELTTEIEGVEEE